MFYGTVNNRLEHLRVEEVEGLFNIIKMFKQTISRWKIIYIVFDYGCFTTVNANTHNS